MERTDIASIETIDRDLETDIASTETIDRDLESSAVEEGWQMDLFLCNNFHTSFPSLHHLQILSEPQPYLNSNSGQCKVTLSYTNILCHFRQLSFGYYHKELTYAMLEILRQQSLATIDIDLEIVRSVSCNLSFLHKSFCERGTLYIAGNDFVS